MKLQVSSWFDSNSYDSIVVNVILEILKCLTGVFKRNLKRKNQGSSNNILSKMKKQQKPHLTTNEPQQAPLNGFFFATKYLGHYKSNYSYTIVLNLF